MFEEKNTKNNLPAQIDIYATDGDEYKFLFVAKGGGSGNKTYLYQKTKALLNPEPLGDSSGSTTHVSVIDEDGNEVTLDGAAGSLALLEGPEGRRRPW